MAVAINTPAPVRKTVRVSRQSVVVEPRPNGRWYETGIDGSECDWGHVIAWEPPSRLVLTWQIDGSWQYNEKFVTGLEVRFIADGTNGTRVELEHRNLQAYGEGAEAMRAALDGDEGWGAELASYIAATQT